MQSPLFKLSPPLRIRAANGSPKLEETLPKTRGKGIGEQGLTTEGDGARWEGLPLTPVDAGCNLSPIS